MILFLENEKDYILYIFLFWASRIKEPKKKIKKKWKIYPILDKLKTSHFLLASHIKKTKNLKKKKIKIYTRNFKKKNQNLILFLVN